MLDCSIVVSTFGNYKWQLLAQERALPNARSFGLPVIYNHGETLHDTRNKGLSEVQTEWVCFLDADDELEPRYFEEMEKAKGDLRAPAVRYTGFSPFIPRVNGHSHGGCIGYCLREGNWCVVGTVAKTELVREVGGWRDYPVLEDFDLWQRCWLAGATVSPVPRAVYRAYSTREGRNLSVPFEEAEVIRKQICRNNMGDEKI